MALVTSADITTYLGLSSALSAATQARLDLAQSIAESAINEFLQNSLGYAVHTEYYPTGEFVIDDELVEYPSYLNGNAGRWSQLTAKSIHLKHTPVHVGGLQVFMDNDANAGQGVSPFGPASALVIGDDFFLDVNDGNLSTSESGILYILSGSWSTKPRSIKVVYYGGFRELPAVLNDAVLMTIAHVYRRMVRTAAVVSGNNVLSSESVGDYSWSADQASMSLGGVGFGAIPPQVVAQLWKYKNYSYMD